MLEVDLIILISLFSVMRISDSVSFPCTWKKKKKIFLLSVICDVIASQSSHLAPNDNKAIIPVVLCSLVRSRTLRPMQE